jgi:hypothetical protein
MRVRQSAWIVTSVLLLGAAPPPAPTSARGRASQAVSEWVFVGADSRLHYKADAQGNQIMDFSSAGYQGGGVPLPVVSVAANVSPIAGDNTPAIQAAIDMVSKAAPGADGFRGAVLLAAGTYGVSGTINLTTSGVVVRGSGSAAGGTILNMTGTAHVMFAIGGTGSRQKGANVAMTDAYVPSGATSFNVSDGSKFKVGDPVVVGRPVTQPWVHLLGMDALVGTTGPQTWIGVGSVIESDRTIAAVSGNQITLDVPLADSFDATYITPPGGTVATYAFPGRVEDIGVEHLQVVAPAVDVIISSPQFVGAQIDAVEDAWLEDLVFQDTQNTVTVGNAAKRLTIDTVHVNHTLPHTGDRMADFGLSGTQILVNKSSSDGTGEWPLLTQGEVSGPIVALNFTSSQAAGIGPHQRWAVGLLADNASLPQAPNNADGGATGISYSDRGNHGSGQGWAMGWGVAWNVTTPHLVVQQPPGAQNWCIGCVGTVTTAVEAGSGKTVPNGIFESLGTKVTPNSLYLAQLCDRLGPNALVNIGYAASDCAVPGDAAPDAGVAGLDASTPGPTPGPTPEPGADAGGPIATADAGATGPGGETSPSGETASARGGCACSIGRRADSTSALSPSASIVGAPRRDRGSSGDEPFAWVALAGFAAVRRRRRTALRSRD